MRGLSGAISLDFSVQEPYRVPFSLYTKICEHVGKIPLSDTTPAALYRNLIGSKGKNAKQRGIPDAKCYGSTLGLRITPKWTKSIGRKRLSITLVTCNPRVVQTAIRFSAMLAVLPAISEHLNNPQTLPTPKTASKMP